MRQTSCIAQRADTVSRNMVFSEHMPQGHPCGRCGRSAYAHRVYHRPKGDPCKVCRLPPSCHRVRTYTERPPASDVYIGLDGEGHGKKHHKYVMLGAATETGDRSWYVQDPNGLSTKRCLDFLINLPTNHHAYSYAFNYDITKIIQDLDDRSIWYLMRPEKRQRPGSNMVGPRPVYWEGYYLNLQGSKFTVKRNGRTRIVWDIFRFFQGKFVAAIKDWKVGNAELWERMSEMKDQRGDFDRLWVTPDGPRKIREYMTEECVCMAQLARRLVTAHEAVGLTLKAFYGAGSSATAMLKKMGIKEKILEPPKEVQIPISMAFFGGRFENSVVGSMRGVIHNKDISSAYPYQLCFLPCLLHGKWTHTKRRNDIEGSTTALVRYAFNSSAKHWAPFPFRDKGGTICFPAVSGGGWIWRDEYVAGERIFPASTKFLEAYLYHTDCDCRPFEKIAEYYLERLRIGKEGPGIVLKLGMNSCYGKLAQSVGRGLFNSWIWAGLITSGTRAQILDLLALHKDPANLLMIATDGIYTREEFDAPKPRNTGTDIVVTDGSTGKQVRKPLGGWESDRHDSGVFVARPGIYFPLNPTTDQIKKVRARGIGKKSVLENWRKIVAGWNKNRDTKPLRLDSLSRFCGAKSSIHRRVVDGKEIYHRADGRDSTPEHEMPSYGNWIKRPVDMTFNPMPKRECINSDGTLRLRRLPKDLVSIPYKKANLSEEAIQLKAMLLELMEQPDADHAEYE